MQGVMEKLKSVPLPIWIGLGLVLVVIFIANSGGQKATSQQTAGPVTGSTVGTQGTQPSAGTDQQLGNLSQITQGGFEQIANQEKGTQEMLASLGANMNGVGTGQQQFGGSMQTVQNNTAIRNAANGIAGQNAGQNPADVIQPSQVNANQTPTPTGSSV